MQINSIVKKANRILGMLKGTFYSRDPRLWTDCYVSLVEFAVQAWNPYLEKDITKIVGLHLQRKAHSVVQNYISYCSWKHKLDLANVVCYVIHLRS